MNAKLTLKLNSIAIEKAKLYAKSRHTSLSALVENYFRTLAEEKKYAEAELSPIVEELSGIIDLPEDFNLKDEYTDYLIKKYSENA